LLAENGYWSLILSGSADQTHIILPVMLATTGPVPIVVLAMRLRFADATSEKPMDWDWTRSTVDPNAGDSRQGGPREVERLIGWLTAWGKPEPSTGRDHQHADQGGHVDMSGIPGRHQ